MCSGATGATSISSTVRILGDEKEKHCDFAGMDGALLVSRDPDPNDAQDAVGPRRVWPWPYPLSRSILDFRTSRSGNKGPSVDARESDFDNVKHGRRQWSKEHLESAYIFIVVCDFVLLLISIFFLVRSHHFDCFSATPSRRLLSLPVPQPGTYWTPSLYSSLSRGALPSSP